MTGRFGRRLPVVAAAVVLVTSLAAPVAGGGGDLDDDHERRIGGSFVQQGPAGLFAAGVRGSRRGSSSRIPCSPSRGSGSRPSNSRSRRCRRGPPSPAPHSRCGTGGRRQPGHLPHQRLRGRRGGDGRRHGPRPARPSPTWRDGTGYQAHDVTALITPAMLASGWAGFLVRAGYDRLRYRPPQPRLPG